MKVFVVTHGNSMDEYAEVAAVFSTRELAEQYVEKYKDHLINAIFINEFEVDGEKKKMDLGVFEYRVGLTENYPSTLNDVDSLGCQNEYYEQPKIKGYYFDRSDYTYNDDEEILVELKVKLWAKSRNAALDKALSIKKEAIAKFKAENEVDVN